MNLTMSLKDLLRQFINFKISVGAGVFLPLIQKEIGIFTSNVFYGHLTDCFIRKTIPIFLSFHIANIVPGVNGFSQMYNHTI